LNFSISTTPKLRLLNEQARQFAEEYPGIAERLGGILEDRVDPLIGGLLEGTAFLAARVQLKLKHEFPEFTRILLEQLVPHYLAPTPSMMIVKAKPVFGDPALREGAAITRGCYLDAGFRQLDPADRMPLPPVRRHHDMAIRTGRRGISCIACAPAGARSFRRGRSAGGPAAQPDTPFNGTIRRRPSEPMHGRAGAPDCGCRTSQLPLYFVARKPTRSRCTNKLFAHCRGIYFRHLDQFGNPVVFEARWNVCSRSDSTATIRCSPGDHRVFEGSTCTRILRLSAQISRLPSHRHQRVPVSHHVENGRYHICL